MVVELRHTPSAINSQDSWMPWLASMEMGMSACLKGADASMPSFKEQWSLWGRNVPPSQKNTLTGLNKQSHARKEQSPKGSGGVMGRMGTPRKTHLQLLASRRP